MRVLTLRACVHHPSKAVRLALARAPPAGGPACTAHALHQPLRVAARADESPDALRAMALASRAASRALQALSSDDRCAILHRIADGLLASQDAILAGTSSAARVRVRA